MDVYYRKLMGNGSVASKFKLDKKPYSETRADVPEYESERVLSSASCSRCHRMKMRCSRTLPHCENCLRRQVSCEYGSRREAGEKNAERNSEKSQKSEKSEKSEKSDQSDQSEKSTSATGDSYRISIDIPVFGAKGETHHSSCVRCYKSKKKCSRTFPVCDTCQKACAECQYVERRRKKPRQETVVGTETSDNGKVGEGERSEVKSEPVAARSEEASMERFREGSPEGPSRFEGSREGSRIEGRSENDIHGAGASSASPTEPQENRQGDFGPEGEAFRNIDLPAYVQATNTSHPHRHHASSQSFKTRASQRSFSVAQKVVSSSIPSSSAGNLEEEFLVVRPIKDASLPSLFVHTFFANYEWRYPFLSRPSYIQKLQGISFKNETFVQLDIYMVMAIGCLIYDTNYNTRHYGEYFSDSLIESMVDIISYDIKSEEDLHKAHLLILLSIYAINVSNLNLIWNIVGFLNRLIVFMTDFSGRTETCMRKRCFWTIFNLDKELSLVLNKLSQFVPTKIIRLDTNFQETLHDGEPEAIGTLMSSSVHLHKLQDRMLSLKMGLVEKDSAVLTQFSADLEAWRVSISSLIHKEYSESALLPNFIGLVNLDYYYLLIEMDQLSATESLQFTLQFLSNSFSLLLQESSDKKHADATSTYSLFWFVKFFKVIDYSVDSLPRILSPELSKAELSLRLNEFNSNSQLIVNLLKFLLNNDMKPTRFVERLETYVEKLKMINMKLSAFNPLVASGETIKKMGLDLVNDFVTPS